MSHRFKAYILPLLCGVLVLALAACTPEGAAPTSDLPDTSPSQEAEPSPSPSDILTPLPEDSQAPSVQPSDEVPDASGDIPATQPDEETTLSFSLDGVSLTVEALRHHSLQGYSIVYDTEHYTCQQWGEGDSYWASQSNYLSVSLVQGLSLDAVVEGLRLQEDIQEEAQSVSIGAGPYAASTLSVAVNGVYRQFWAVALDSGDVLLVEQSYVEGADTAALYQASQAAMLSTLTLES